MSVWISGVVFSAIAILFGYYSQFYFRKAADRNREALWAEFEDEKEKLGAKKSEGSCLDRKGRRTRGVSEIFVALALIAFVSGTVLATIAVF
jgi:hypothetical protein